MSERITLGKVMREIPLDELRRTQKVYVLCRLQFDKDGFSTVEAVLSVWSSREAAREEAMRLCLELKEDGDLLEVAEFEVKSVP
jgi:hypothetical protein